ncbi:hypothetical protein BLOT_008367 [Blomia tropicalis]|nr:hypothetical protein BLOT_008367 [Blomia tropicalis]
MSSLKCFGSSSKYELYISIRLLNRRPDVDFDFMLRPQFRIDSGGGGGGDDGGGDRYTVGASIPNISNCDGSSSHKYKIIVRTNMETILTFSNDELDVALCLADMIIFNY